MAAATAPAAGMGVTGACRLAGHCAAASGPCSASGSQTSSASSRKLVSRSGVEPRSSFHCPPVTGGYLSSRSSTSNAFFQSVRRSTTVRRSACPSRGRVTMMPIGVPRVPYRTPGEGGWQWVDIWNVLYRERIIFIGEAIDEDYGNQVLATMLYLDSLDTNKPMWLYINSPGGDITPCLTLYDTMESISAPVGALCIGFAYNMGGFLLAGGAKGKRLAMPMSRISIQSPAGSAGGSADDLKNEADELLRVRDYVYSELAKKVGKDPEQIHKDFARQKRFSAQEALEYGLIDRVLRPRRIKPDASKKAAAVA